MKPIDPGRNDHDYLLARAIQFFNPGVPQVYYAGLLADGNDMALLAKSGVGRDINRHYYTPEEIDQALQRPVVQSLFELIRFRNRHTVLMARSACLKLGESISFISLPVKATECAGVSHRLLPSQIH